MQPYITFWNTFENPHFAHRQIIHHCCSFPVVVESVSLLIWSKCVIFGLPLSHYPFVGPQSYMKAINSNLVYSESWLRWTIDRFRYFICDCHKLETAQGSPQNVCNDWLILLFFLWSGYTQWGRHFYLNEAEIFIGLTWHQLDILIAEMWAR